MLVKESMTKHVELGDTDMSVCEAAQKMKDGDFGVLPIQEHDRLVGMVTDRDIVVRAVAEGKDLDETTVADIMTHQVLYCYEDQDITEVAENLGDQQVRRLPVLNRDKRLVGILSIGDLAKSKGAPHQVEDALSRISKSKGDFGGQSRTLQ